MLYYTYNAISYSFNISIYLWNFDTIKIYI